MRVVVIRMHTLDLPSSLRVDERVDIKLNHAKANLPPDASRMAHGHYVTQAQHIGQPELDFRARLPVGLRNHRSGPHRTQKPEGHRPSMNHRAAVSSCSGGRRLAGGGRSVGI